jgi:hypothetical protein
MEPAKIELVRFQEAIPTYPGSPTLTHWQLYLDWQSNPAPSRLFPVDLPAYPIDRQTVSGVFVWTCARYHYTIDPEDILWKKVDGYWYAKWSRDWIGWRHPAGNGDGPCGDTQ